MTFTASQSKDIGKGMLATVNRVNGGSPPPPPKTPYKQEPTVPKFVLGSIKTLLDYTGGDLQKVLKLLEPHLKPIPQPVVESKWITVKEYAEAHGKSIYTVYDWKRTGRLPHKVVKVHGHNRIFVRDVLPSPDRRKRRK